MALPNVQNISFGYSFILKKLYNEDKLPNLVHGLYGGVLTKEKNKPDSATVEHVVCHCFGGATKPYNLAIATYFNNNKRGNAPLSTIFTKKNMEQYFNELRGTKVQYMHKGKLCIFDADQYCDNLYKTIVKELTKEGKLDLLA